jgi:flagellar assembly factor FliW
MSERRSSQTSAAAWNPAEAVEPLDSRRIISFPDGLPGFESCRRFLLVSSDDSAPFQVLRGIDPPQPSFVAIHPALVLPRYRTSLSQADHVRLQVSDRNALVWLGIVMLESDGTASVNLRAPIVINPEAMVGFQVMPHECLYPLRHPLSL